MPSRFVENHVRAIVTSLSVGNSAGMKKGNLAGVASSGRWSGHPLRMDRRTLKVLLRLGTASRLMEIWQDPEVAYGVGRNVNSVTVLWCWVDPTVMRDSLSK